ncbi:MAG: helix-turn-helix domain-containing protein [Tissierellaceae bacterium]
MIKHDRLNKSNLVETLKVYLEMDCNIKATADELFIHPKTVVYRRNQIEEILNVSLSDVEAKFSLFMALKIKDIHGFKSIDDE